VVCEDGLFSNSSLTFEAARASRSQSAYWPVLDWTDSGRQRMPFRTGSPFIQIEQPSQQIKLSASELLTLKEDPLPYIGTSRDSAVPA
jgi:hypothetical protein